jgi:hypothetical protein
MDTGRVTESPTDPGCTVGAGRDVGPTTTWDRGRSRKGIAMSYQQPFPQPTGSGPAPVPLPTTHGSAARPPGSRSAWTSFITGRWGFLILGSVLGFVVGALAV